MDGITKDQKKVVNELRRRTIKDATPKMLEDVSLFYRFSKARDFNLDKAEVMLKNHIAWRKEMQMDTILTDYEPPEVLVNYVPTTFLCFDKEENIIRIVDGGRTDLKGLWNATKKTEFSKYICYLIEQDIETAVKSGRNLGKPFYSGIYDLENLSYTDTVSIKTFQFVLHIVKMFLDNYPELIKRISVINAPAYFSWLYAALKQFLPSAVIEKVRIYGTDGWKEDFLEFIAADYLPAYLGGNKTDPDGNPLCETFIHRGRPVPKSYYMSKGCKILSLETDVKKFTVMPLSKEEITFEVNEENSYLEWEFETKNRDIDFWLVFSEKSSENLEHVQLIPKQRSRTSDEPEKGCLKCEKVGNYTLVFDNSFSWLHSKEIYYRAGIHDIKNEDIFEAT